MWKEFPTCKNLACEFVLTLNLWTEQICRCISYYMSFINAHLSFPDAIIEYCNGWH